MTLQRIHEVLDDLDRATFHIVACGSGAPSDARVSQVAADLGLTLPEPFSAFATSRYGTMYLEVHEKLWPENRPGDVGPFWQGLRGIMVFGMAEGAPDWLDISAQADVARHSGMEDLVPFMRIEGDPDRYCFTSDGQVVHWHREDPDAREVVAESFTDLLLREIGELQARQAQRVAEL